MAWHQGVEAGENCDRRSVRGSSAAIGISAVNGRGRSRTLTREAIEKAVLVERAGAAATETEGGNYATRPTTYRSLVWRTSAMLKEVSITSEFRRNRPLQIRRLPTRSTPNLRKPETSRIASNSRRYPASTPISLPHRAFKSAQEEVQLSGGSGRAYTLAPPLESGGCTTRCRHVKP